MMLVDPCRMCIDDWSFKLKLGVSADNGRFLP